MTSPPVLARLFPRAARAGCTAIASVCSAHPVVLEAALRLGKARGEEVLVEATCNQVNHEGGYTGMTPADFRRRVEEMADRCGLDRACLVLGGDHLGPNPWRRLPAERALAAAEAMVDAYARAGFRKLHLDTSMACQGDPPNLPEEVIAARAARLAQVAEAAAPAPASLAYVIGTEVPVPGGAREEQPGPQVTAAEAVVTTVELHRGVFAGQALEAAFERAIAVVVQPGLEFGNTEVLRYDPGRAGGLAAARPRISPLAFEAHSTDYQPAAALAALARDGFAILKVGPELTFALREALYGLDHVAAALLGTPEPETLRAVVERVMVREPAHWAGYCSGTAADQRLLRHFGYSDRVRYYWSHPEVAAAVTRLLDALGPRHLPASLVGQYLGTLLPEVLACRRAPTAGELLRGTVERVLERYRTACG
jgi:D-tagatose-1,6-bisphosphate aldolase subunit GatZ/KbaZ